MSRYDVARSGDYSLSSVEMAVALGAIPPQRRSNAWLLLMAAPVATAAAREALRSGNPAPLDSSWWTLLGPAIVSTVGAVGLFATRYSATRPRLRCY